MPYVENRNYVWVAQRAGRSCFLLKPGDTARVSGERSRKGFDGDVALQSQIAAGAINLAHPTPAYERNNLEISKLVAGLYRERLFRNG